MKDYNLLVVDDEPFVLNLSIRVLNNLGFERIATASTGKGALAMVTSAEEPYDIIICDLNMPEMDGVAFMRLVSETDYSGSLILLSGEEERMLETTLELAKAHSLNVLGFIQKPIKPDLLNDLIAQHNPNSGDSNRFTPQDPITEEELRDGLARTATMMSSWFIDPRCMSAPARSPEWKRWRDGSIRNAACSGPGHSSRWPKRPVLSRN